MVNTESISNAMLCDNLPFKRVGMVVQRVRREAELFSSLQGLLANAMLSALCIVFSLL